MKTLPKTKYNEIKVMQRLICRETRLDERWCHDAGHLEHMSNTGVAGSGYTLNQHC